MNVTDALKLLIEYPNSEMVDLLATLSSKESIFKEYVAVLVKVRESIKKFEAEKDKITNKLNNIDDIGNIKNGSIERELDHTNIALIDSKIREKMQLKELLQLKCNHLYGKISDDEYVSQRDETVSNIILIRARLYKQKEWIKSFCKQSKIEINSEWYLQFDIYISGNKRDTMYDVKNKTQEARQIYQYLENKKNQNETILPENNNVKEAMSLIISLPEYVSRQTRELDNSQLLDSQVTEQRRTR